MEQATHEDGGRDCRDTLKSQGHKGPGSLGVGKGRDGVLPGTFRGNRLCSAWVSDFLAFRVGGLTSDVVNHSDLGHLSW